MESQTKRAANGERSDALPPLLPEPPTTDVASALESPVPHNGSSRPANGSAGANGSPKPDGSARANGSARSSGRGALAAVPDRVRTYEELDGAEGRAVFFRPHRYTAAELAPLRCTVSLLTTDGPIECDLLDVSQNGVAMAWPAGMPVQLHERLQVVLRFDEHVSFRGESQVGSIREQDGATTVGISFVDFLLDVDEILQLRTMRRWNGQRAAAQEQSRPWHVPGCNRFKALVAELRLFLEDAQQHFGELEAQLPWHVLQEGGHPVRAALMSELRRSFVVDGIRLQEEIDAAVRELPHAYRSPAAKEWSQRHVQQFLMQSPGLHRCRHKPFGYPGDYECMNFLYERHFDGATLFARSMTLVGCHSRPGIAVRSRKDLVKREIRALLERRAGSREPVRVLSIAAGPAQELHELFAETDELPVPLEVVLFEQDKNALAHAWRRLKSSVEARFPKRVRLTFLHDSIKRLLRDEDLFAPFGKFDLIYCCGMMDYLQRSTAVVLTRRLAAASVPGGKVLVANMVDNAGRWLMEFHLDWTLIYRTRDELLEIGRRAVPDAGHRILEEASGTNPFLELIRG